MLERLHASFFFYILVNTAVFLKIGFFLPSVVIISVAMMFSGLHEWVNAAWYMTANSATSEKQTTAVPSQIWAARTRPLLQTLLVMTATHVAGIVLFFAIKSPWATAHYNVREDTILL